MAIVNAKEFCKRTGFPLAMLRAFCREGKISHWTRGRVYWMDEKEAVEELKKLQDTGARKPYCVTNKPFTERRHFSSGMFDYRAEVAKLQAQCKSNARLDDKEEA